MYIQHPPSMKAMSSKTEKIHRTDIIQNKCRQQNTEIKARTCKTFALNTDHILERVKTDNPKTF